MLLRDGLGASFATRARRITSRRDCSGLSDDLLPGSGDSLSGGRATGCCGRGLGERPAPWEGRAEKALRTHPLLRLPPSRRGGLAVTEAAREDQRVVFRIPLLWKLRTASGPT